MRRHIAFYVHHHGRGHTSRTRAVIDELQLPTTVLTSAPADGGAFGHAAVVELPRDDGPREAVLEGVGTPGHLHYAPLGIAGVRERTARITGFLADVAPSLLVVDVSAEVAQLSRLTGTPTVVVRQHGERWDRAHRAAYESAVALLAPFGPALEEPDVPAAVRDRTFYAGGLARGAGRRGRSAADRGEVRRRLGWSPDDRGVVVLLGSGGSGPSRQDVADAARATAGYRWAVVGGDGAPTDAAVTPVGWVPDPLPYLAAADVVVGSAGHNTVMEAALVRRPFVCIPEERPFDEQQRKADRLRALDAAEVHRTWPPAADWPDVLARAGRRGGGALGALVDGRAAERTAGWLTDLAVRFAA